MVKFKLSCNLTPAHELLDQRLINPYAVILTSVWRWGLDKDRSVFPSDFLPLVTVGDEFPVSNNLTSLRIAVHVDPRRVVVG